MKKDKEVAAADIDRIGKGTGPLSWEQLSDGELTIIIEIERRLYEIQAQAEQLQNDKNKTDLSKDEDFPPLKNAQQHYERVCLIDGGRGTGKSSLLQTLIERWSDEKKRNMLALDRTYKERVESLKVSDFVNSLRDTEIPSFVKVFYLDFDPLPHKMPLMAGIVQAWKSLAKYYDKSSGKLEECDDENATLEDQWHALFQVAAVGWSDISHKGGLIEQVLNHEDQVENWHRLQEEWERFVDRLIEAGRCAQDPKYKITETPVFVIAIDDVDLQVERMRELLPALQNLQHPNVLFIVAADKAHMQDMLQLSFLGQQRRLANVQPIDRADSPNKNIWLDRKEGWPETLAQESIRKVFPPRNTWKLRRLSLRQMLDFPRADKKTRTFETYFESWRQQDSQKSGNFGNLAEYLGVMAGKPEDSVRLPPIISYRVADQIFQRVSHRNTETDFKAGALVAIRDILAQPDEDLVRIARRSEEKNQNLASGSKEKNKVSDNLPAATTEAPKTDIRLAANIIYQEIGNLQAVFPGVFEYDMGNDSEIVLSGYPYFLCEIGVSKKPVRMESPEFVTALIAGSLRDDGYGILAPGLRWNIRTAIAWTSARVLELGLYLTLRWQLHIHPSPLRLYRWANEWNEFIETLSTETQNLESRVAYAWIYYQLTWLGTDVRTIQPELPAPTMADLDPEKYWRELLKLGPRHGSDKEIPLWKSRILPLMARPELGLPPSLQEHLLTPEQGIDQKWLRDQRERLITDGIIASQDLGMPTPTNPEEQELARKAAKIFDGRYSETHDGKQSAWERYVGPPSSVTKTRDEK
jgi:hypothetical protein